MWEIKYEQQNKILTSVTPFSEGNYEWAFTKLATARQAHTSGWQSLTPAHLPYYFNFHHSNLFNYSSGQELFDVQVINPSHPWAPDWPSQVNLLVNSLFMFQLLFHKTFNAFCSFLSSVSMKCNFNELKILFQLVVLVVQLQIIPIMVIVFYDVHYFSVRYFTIIMTVPVFFNNMSLALL